jgi:predicted Zn-dependent protease
MHRLIGAALVLSVSATATAGAYWQRAAELIQTQDYAAAHTEIQGLLAARPDDQLLLRLSGVTLIHTDRLDEAVAVLGRATQGDPDNVASWFDLNNNFGLEAVGARIRESNEEKGLASSPLGWDRRFVIGRRPDSLTV